MWAGGIWGVLDKKVVKYALFKNNNNLENLPNIECAIV